VPEENVRCLKIVLPTSGLPGATRLGERPEPVEGERDLPSEGDRIKHRELDMERVALSGREDPRPDPFAGPVHRGNESYESAIAAGWVLELATLHAHGLRRVVGLFDERGAAIQESGH